MTDRMYFSAFTAAALVAAVGLGGEGWRAQWGVDGEGRGEGGNLFGCFV